MEEDDDSVNQQRPHDRRAIPAGVREVTSDYEPSINDSVTFGSLTSSVNSHIYEYGRRYHVFRYGRYPLPNDDEEIDRETMKHIMLKELLDGRLFLAPIGDNPQKIIDLGTGSGDWAIEVGDRFPSAKVIGVDLSPIQPVWVPQNVEFQVDDIEDNWGHPNDFDYMHLRFMCTVLKDNAKVIRTAFENLIPGGWIEVQDINPRFVSDGTPLPHDYPLTRIYELLDGPWRSQYQFNLWSVEDIPKQMEDAGFINVNKQIFLLPIGDWSRDVHLRTIGRYFRTVMTEFLPAMAAKPFAEADMDEDEVGQLFDAAVRAMSDPSIHAYMPVHFIWAQKPLTAVT